MDPRRGPGTHFERISDPGLDLTLFYWISAVFCFSFWQGGAGTQAEQNEQQKEKERLGPALPWGVGVAV